MRGAHKRIILGGALGCLAGAALMLSSAAAQLCKWVDEDGCVHYAEQCPEGVQGEQVELQPGPSAEQVQAAEQRAAEAAGRKRIPEPATAQAGKSLSLHELGPLPENATSRYLTTLGTGINADTREMNAQFTLRVRANPGLPAGAYIEARFPDPAGRGNRHVTGMALDRPQAEVLFLSPGSKGFKCMNYEVEVLVFADEARETLLGTHRQTIQSRLDMSGVRNRLDLLEGMAGKFCPDDLSGKSAAELEAMCEAAREMRLQPLREAEIRRCIEEQGKDPAYCERYFSTYGDSELRGNRVLPRMFDDLPECVAARQARAGAGR